MGRSSGEDKREETPKPRVNWTYAQRLYNFRWKEYSLSGLARQDDGSQTKELTNELTWSTVIELEDLYVCLGKMRKSEI
jgi:hypothetical protein